MLSHRVVVRSPGVREGGVVGTLSTPEANNSQGDLIARQSEHGQVFRPEGPRHTPVQQGLNQLDLPHAELQTKLSGRHIIQLPVELSEACPH